MERNKVDKFIEFVVDLVNENDIFMEGSSSKYYFTHGGCFELYKIIKHYIPEVVCMIDKGLEHCAIGYETEIYDANGKIENKEDFMVATEEDILYMRNSFGLGIKSLECESIVNDIEECNVKGIYY